MAEERDNFQLQGEKKSDGVTAMKYQDDIPATFKIGCIPQEVSFSISS